MTQGTLLRAEELTVERGGRELFSGFNMALDAGELVHLRGPNGAGKTTLLRILAGLSRYGYEGRVSREGACLYLGHHSAVKGLLTPRENLAWHPGGENHGDRARIDTALAAVGLYGYEDVPAGRLSAGQQRRVDLARLFLSERPLWLLDEPFTAIDVEGVAALTERLWMHAHGGGAVLMTSHQSIAGDGRPRFLDLGDAAPRPESAAGIAARGADNA